MKEAKTSRIGSPLALLQELSDSLITHLEQACGESLVNAEKQLRKLDRQLEKLQARLDKRLLRAEEAIAAGKLKVRSKLATEIAGMQELLAGLQQDHAALLVYIERLRGEITRTLELSAGIGEVARAAGDALSEKPVRVRKTRKPQATLPQPVHAAAEAPVESAPVAARPARRRRPAKPAEPAQD